MKRSQLGSVSTYAIGVLLVTGISQLSQRLIHIKVKHLERNNIKVSDQPSLHFIVYIVYARNSRKDPLTTQSNLDVVVDPTEICYVKIY